MQHDVDALGTTFFDCADLAEEYANGLEGLRRREPGASARMVEIAKLMSQYRQLMGSADASVMPMPLSDSQAAAMSASRSALTTMRPS